MRRATGLATLVVALLAVFAVNATAAPTSLTADPGFTAGSSWTATAGCGLLCAAQGTQPTTGGNPGSQALAEYATVANVLGLAAGNVDFTSASFAWTGATPAAANVHLDVRTSLSTLLSVNGTVGTTVDLVDVTAARTTTIRSIAYTADVPQWTGVDLPVAPSLLTAGHTYKLRLHTSFNALVAVLGGASVGFDNVALTATRTPATVSGTTVGTPTQTGVSIGATLDTAGVDATYHVEYGTTTAYGSATADATLHAADSPGAIGAALTGLTPGTTYHARLVVTTEAGTSYGPDVTFTTAAPNTPPVTTPNPAVGTVTATLDGARGVDLGAVVDLDGATGAQFRFELGTTTAYGTETTLTTVPSAGANGWSTLDAVLASLAPGTTYHVRAAILTGGTWTYGADVTFTTAPATAPTVGAPTITATDTGAQVAADITPNSADAQWVVEWGPTAAYGSTSTPVTVPAGTDPVRAVYDITGLQADTDYHVRFKATSADGTTYGADTVFHTATDPNTTVTVPTVGAVTATVGSPRTVDLSADVDLNSLVGADFRFEYGTTTAYGETTAIATVPSAGLSGTSALAAALSGLTPGATYHVRAAVRVNGVWTYGADVTFTTNPALAPVLADVAATATANAAHLTAKVTPRTAATRWHVEYGTTTAYGSTSAAVTLPAGGTALPVSFDLAGLKADTVYHYRFVATSDDGSVDSGDRTVRTGVAEDGGTTTTQGTENGGDDTPTTTAPTATTATPTTPTATPATPAKTATPASCRAVTILARTRGLKVTMDAFVTAGAPLAVTPRAQAKNIKKVTLDGKAVAATVTGRTVRLAATALKVGRHTLAIGTGPRAARLTLQVGTCAARLAVRSAGGHARVVLTTVPGTTTAAFFLPKAYIKALASGTLSIRANGKTTTAKIAARAQRTGTTVTVTGLPANVTEVRLTLSTKQRMAARGVSATVTNARGSARLKARTIGTSA